ncbi:MAG: efflux RND transporter permease subunit [Chitinophagaceae bacterium]
MRKSAIDILPTVNTPTIYVAQTYGGLSPQQMEGFITSYYEYHFLYITGIKAVESKSIQGLALIKLQFHEGTDMASAMAETISYATRARSFMPPGTLPPFVMRYDAGSIPIGQLVFSSDSRSLNEIQDLALFKVRPMFAGLSGVSAPPPFGGNQRTVLIKADPERLRSYNITADEVVTAIARNNSILPAGNIRMNDKSVITSSNSIVDNFKELESVVVKNVNGTPVFVRDLATVDNGADVTTGYALINGKRSVYIPVTKRADASTWDVVQQIKKALPDMQAAIPDDIKVTYEFDQSGYVVNALKSLVFEGLLGALLTGLMVLLFLRDLRSSLIVVTSIPLALLSSLVCLYLCGQTINIMTLGGLALAVGILVDESTVTIENIHKHLESGKPKERAIWDACREIAVPKLLILLSILSVFVPALFMSGVPRSMFLPLSLAVGFAMIASFLLSQSLLPVLANRVLKREHKTKVDSLVD